MVNALFAETLFGVGASRQLAKLTVKTVKMCLYEPVCDYHIQPSYTSILSLDSAWNVLKP